jgi:KaiC/GvpD/RAD55 family RecA-like ATPase
VRTSLVDVRDKTSLSNALSQVFLFVEHLNAEAYFSMKKSWLSSDVGTRQIPGLKGIVHNLGRDFSRPERSWGHKTTLLRLLKESGIQPPVNPAIVQAVVELMERLDLPTITKPEKLRTRAGFYPSLSGRSFASPPIIGGNAHASTFSLVYWEEPWDAIAVVQLFLADVLGEQGRAVDHHLQQWLRATFGLAYNKDTKYCLSTICERFNTIFYEAPIPSSQDIHVRRPGTIGISLLVTEILLLLKVVRRDEAQIEEKDLLCQALGIYLFIRFCRQLRSRFFWASDLEADGQEQAEHLEECQCVSALRPLGYTYFQARIFGWISVIPGLSNIFRGGLLPRTDGGTTVTLIGPPGGGKTVVALQMMVDIARFGGLAVYLSFEESYDSVLDRLVTFGLYDREKFLVQPAGQNIENVVHAALESNPEKGILILYHHDKSDSFDLIEAIRQIVEATERFERAKALVIDSISALDIRAISSPNAEFSHRTNLRALIDVIEESGFLGLILSEKDDSSSITLSYLADTVIQVGSDELTHNRWIEITKCRIQDYQSGRHPFRMMDGRGVVIYPSLVSRRSSLRRRVRSTLSEHRRVPLPEPWSKGLQVHTIQEKSSTLLWGPPGGGKTLLLLNLLTEPPWVVGGGSNSKGSDVNMMQGAFPRNVLLITFRTSEVNFLQALRRDPLLKRWDQIKKKKQRWFSPGENLSGDQIVTEIWKYISRSRREGIPVDRMGFDETEVAEDFLPGLKRETLFWSTLLEITSTEAATSFFVYGNDDRDSPLMKVLRASVDYVFHIKDGSTTTVQKHPNLQPSGRRYGTEAPPLANHVRESISEELEDEDDLHL